MKQTLLKKSFSLKRLTGFFLILFFGAFQNSSFALLQTSAAPAVPSASKSFQNFSEVANKAFIQNAFAPASDSVTQPAFFDSLKPVAGVYHYQNRYRQFARVVFASESKNSNPYLAYEISNDGNFGKIIESGYRENNSFVRERIYDYKTATVTIYNRSNIFEKRVYELVENGEAGRPVQFRGRFENGNLANILFLYEKNTVTCVYAHGMTFATYEISSEGTLGNLIRIGNASSLHQGKLEVKRQIGIATVVRDGREIPVYQFEGNGSKVLRERLAGSGQELGPIGRVLRYQSETADLEYFYDDQNKEVSRLLIYNRLTQEMLGFELPKNALAEGSGRISRAKGNDRESFFAGVSGVNGSLMKALADSLEMPELRGFNYGNQENLPDKLIQERLLRGPPAADATAFVLSRVFSPVFVSFLSYYIRFEVVS